MQCMINCSKYTSDSNPNKTCNNQTRCILWSDSSICYNYTEKQEVFNTYGKENNNGSR